MSTASTRTVILTTLGMGAGWILLVAGTKPHEMLVGAVVIVASMALLVRVLREQRLKFRFRARHFLLIWRTPWSIAQDCARITWFLLKDLSGQRTGSFYRAAGFRTSAHDPEAIGRSILATLFTTASPNSIVIGIDPSRSLILFHQLERSEVSTMTKMLGAQEGAPR